MVIVVVCVIAVLPRFAAAQPIDVRIDRGSAVEDYDFSWVYWFETHGQRYVREAAGERELPWDTPASRRWRGPVVEALTRALDDEDDDVRAAAVLSLARIGHEGLLDRVLPGDGDRVALLLDPSEAVRLSAWVSLGLMETDAARAALSAEPLEGSGEIDRVGQAVAIGLMTAIDRSHARWLLARLDDAGASLEVKRWCVWSIGRHDDASVDGFLTAVLDGVPSTFVIGQVLGNDAYVQRRGGAVWLGDVLRYHPDVRGWSGYRSLTDAVVYGSTPRRLAMETRIAAALAIAEMPVPTDADDLQFVLSQLRRRMVPGNSAQAMDFNRGFDTLAYVMHSDGLQDDRDLLYNQMRGFTSLLQSDPGVLAGLEAGEEPTAADLFVRQPDNEVRSYAALSAGLLIRRATRGTELHADRPLTFSRAIETERLKRRFGVRLMRAVANRRESISYRAACALALGLTGDDRYAAELAIELGRLQAGDEAVLGYGLLALAMLGEERVADPAVRYLTRPGDVTGVDDLLGRRAALRALGLVGPGSGEAIAQVWGRNRWVSLFAADAAAWGGEYDALPAMLNGLQSESAVWRRTAAASLGRVFDAAWPSRLSALTDGANPTLSLRPPALSTRNRILADDDPLALAWPMGRVYALSDPFFIALKQGAFTPEPADNQDAP